MKRYLLVPLLALSGCSSLQVNLDNRIACAVAHDKAFVVSQYGGVGIASTIASADSAVVCPLPAPVAK